MSYGFDMVQGFGHCVDACCDGGFLLYKKGDRERPLLTIGATPFDVEADEGKYARRKDLFYVNSDNCSGWYKTDDAAYFEVYSSEFRTPENIGVGSSLSEASRAYGTLFFHVGWIEEDANALYFTVSSFEDYRFVLDVEDYLGHWEEISMAGDQHHLKVSDFKKNATVQRILVGKFYFLLNLYLSSIVRILLSRDGFCFVMLKSLVMEVGRGEC